MSDEDVRRHLTDDLDETIFVEAGAGTGKTRALVSRIVALVARGGLQMEHLAAITFTEAAAAELRDRVRAGLEQAMHDSSLAAGEREACARGAAAIDLAAIQTIHAFCGALLRAFPLEAGLPPGFATWDEIQSGQAFEERFRTWLYDEVPSASSAGLRTTVRRALFLGLTPDRLRELAGALQDQYDLLDRDSVWEKPEFPDPLDCCRAGVALADLVPLIANARNGEADPLVQEVRAVQFAAERMAAAQDLDQALAAFEQFLAQPPKLNVGRKGDWSSEGGANPVDGIRAAFREAREAAEAAVLDARAASLSDLLGFLRDFTLDYAETRRRLGVATFHDLLTWARDLLRDQPNVRCQAHARYRRIFVDEFQDTDPLQAEIVTMLAAGPAQAGERDWKRIDLERGVLFLVGDPKQSIYRFRRADIAVYEEMFARLDPAKGGARLVQNYRSQPPVLAWVNAQLAIDMIAGKGVQPAYVPIEPQPGLPIAWPAARPCGVSRIGARGPGSSAEKWQSEADGLARLARTAVQEAWQVTSRDVAGPALRDVGYGDICVLLPTRTNLRRLQRAFEDAGVPYRVESGTLTLHSQEVRDLLACLRAIDDPTDQVALVAALRSSAYACSDLDLLAWVDSGGRLTFDEPFDAEGSEATAQVRGALASLRDLHQARRGRTAAATIEALIRERSLAVQAYAEPRRRETLRRLRYVIERARAFAAHGEPSLRAFLDWLDGLESDTFYDVESPIPEPDEEAVRMLTIHGAKGLEFPVVFLSGLGSRPAGGRGVELAPGRGPNPLEIHSGDFRTTCWDDSLADRAEDAEHVRLLYVAATRARDHLVLSLFHAEKGCGARGCHAERIEQALADGAYPTLHTWDLEAGRPPAPAGRDAATSEPPAWVDHQIWADERRRLIEAAAVEPVLTATRLHGAIAGVQGDDVEAIDLSAAAEDAIQATDPDDLAGVDDVAPGRGSSALGRAVHLALQRVELALLTDIEAVAAQAARRHGILDQTADVRSLTQRLAMSLPVRDAVQGEKYWRELPISVAIDGVILDGIIDLAFERPDGSLGVIDYKTDQIAEQEIGARSLQYHLQGAAYALALQQATGKSVTTLSLIFAGLHAINIQTIEGRPLVDLIDRTREVIGAAKQPA